GEGIEDLLEPLLQRAAAGDDDLGLGQLGPLALDLLEGHELDTLRSRLRSRHGDLFHGRGTAARLGCRELALTHADDLDRREQLAPAVRVARVHGPTVDELAAFGLHRRDVAREARLEGRGDAREKILAERARGPDHDVEALLRDRDDRRRIAL